MTHRAHPKTKTSPKLLTCKVFPGTKMVINPVGLLLQSSQYFTEFWNGLT